MRVDERRRTRKARPTMPGGDSSPFGSLKLHNRAICNCLCSSLFWSAPKDFIEVPGAVLCPRLFLIAGYLEDYKDEETDACVRL